MENLYLMLFICLMAPLSMMLFIFKGKSKVLLFFLLSGIFMCLFASEINGLILNKTNLTLHFITVNITPIVEEVLKAVPVIFITFLTKPQKQDLLEYSLAVGIGFATLENVGMLFNAGSDLSIGFSLIRGFGAGLMHGVTTLAVGYALSNIHTKRKLFFTGTFAALSVAIIYHSIYNIIVQSPQYILGIILPLLTFVPLIIIITKHGKNIIKEK